MHAYFDYLLAIGAVATLAGALVYIRSMARGGARPNRVSWLMWSIAPLIATSAEITKGVGWAALPVFMNGFCPLLILLSSLAVKKSYWKLTKFDYACGLLSAAALVIWAITKTPEIAIIFAIASDGLAAVPTLRKALHSPRSESVWPYAIGIFSGLTAFGVINTWIFSAYAFPAYLVAINLLLSSAVLLGRK